nr:hypothetical protein [Providencia sp. PROV076]
MFFVLKCIVHRHTGGLENEKSSGGIIGGVHRHTGGLETINIPVSYHFLVHRHTGGLENLKTVSI